MSTNNPNCDGAHCVKRKIKYGLHGGVRVYPLGDNSNLILCYDCFRHENEFRRRARRQGVNRPHVNWRTAKVYAP